MRPRPIDIAILVLCMILVAVPALWTMEFGGPEDGETPTGTPEFAVVHVQAGTTTATLGQQLVELGLVDSLREFTGYAEDNPGTGIVGPGYYAVRKGRGVGDVLAQLAEPGNRVGSLTVQDGSRLDDTVDPETGSRVEGLLSRIASASCVPAEPGPRCTTVEALRRAAALAEPVALGVPEWADAPVRALVGDHRRIEGLIAVGRWDFDPTASPEQVLSGLIEGSAKQYGLNSVLRIAAQEQGSTEYQILTLASVLQDAVQPADYSRVAADINSRLRDTQPLQQDVTVNYFMTRPAGAEVSPEDRLIDSPWNTFRVVGLPPTPIGSPGNLAIAVAQHP